MMTKKTYQHTRNSESQFMNLNPAFDKWGHSKSANRVKLRAWADLIGGQVMGSHFGRGSLE